MLVPYSFRVGRILLAGSTALLALACGGHFEVPMPVLSAPAVAPAPSEPAIITLPIAIALSKIRTQLDSVFPPVDSLDRAKCTALGGLVCHQYAYRRDSLDLRANGNRITLQTRLRYRASVGLPGVGGIASCGFPPETMKRAVVQLATTLYWRSDWRLGSRGTTVAATLSDPCEVTLLHVDATPIVKRIIDAQAEDLRQEIDSVLPTVADLHGAADSLWQLAQQPLSLDSASTVWLTFSPEAVSLAPLIGSASSVSTALVLTARPRVTVGAKPSIDPQALPSLTLARRSSGIHVPVEVELPFSDLSQKVTVLLAGDTAGKGIRVSEVKVWGVGDTAVVTVGLEGKVNGSLYLLGRVSYDSVSRAVLLSDLRYTLESHDTMTRLKSTFAAGRIKAAIDAATGKGHLAVGEQLDSLKSRLNYELNRSLAPGVRLAGSVNGVRFSRMFTTQTAFVLRVVLDGEAVILVQ
ncbi:MAG TPA: DUF4403 family protein [Gemmatimonadaceae bacterium]|nr:DUF4403 family protein [Gemmatimonadaceae bacterium]